MANLADDTYFLNLSISESSDQRENISEWDQKYQWQKVLVDQFLSILDCLYYGKASGREELLLCSSSFSGSVCGVHSCEKNVFSNSSTYCLFRQPVCICICICFCICTCICFCFCPCIFVCSFSDHNTCHSFPPSLVAHTCGPPHSVLLQPLWICKTHRGCKKDCICLRRLVFFIVTCISCMSCLVLVYYQYGSSQYFCKLFDPSLWCALHFLLSVSNSWLFQPLESWH